MDSGSRQGPVLGHLKYNVCVQYEQTKSEYEFTVMLLLLQICVFYFNHSMEVALYIFQFYFTTVASVNLLKSRFKRKPLSFYFVTANS